MNRNKNFVPIPYWSSTEISPLYFWLHYIQDIAQALYHILLLLLYKKDQKYKEVPPLIFPLHYLQLKVKRILCRRNRDLYQIIIFVPVKSINCIFNKVNQNNINKLLHLKVTIRFPLSWHGTWFLALILFPLKSLYYLLLFQCFLEYIYQMLFLKI